MNCDMVRERLSAYYDAELDEKLATQVRQHLACCDSCSAEFRCFGSMSALVTAAACGGGAPPPWASVLASLESPPQAESPLRIETRPLIASGTARKSRWRIAASAALALAAGILVVVGIRSADEPHQHAASHRLSASVAPIDLGAVIQRFKSGPDAAVDLLLRQSGAREVTSSADGGESIVALASLSGYRPVSTRVLQFPSCTCGPGECSCEGGGCGCVASVYQRDDRSTFLVVEQCTSHPVSFGLLPRHQVEKGGQSVQQLRSNALLAVSWETDRRRYTAIGLRGEREADHVVAAAAAKL